MLQGRALTLALTLSLKKCLTCIPSVVLVKVHGIALDLVRLRLRVKGEGEGEVRVR